MFKLLVRNIFAFIVAMAMVPAAMALSGQGASGVEPGDSCEADNLGLFKRAAGAPFSGTLTMIWDSASGDVSYFGPVAQFGSTCTVQVTGKVAGIPLDAFQSFQGRDIARLCLKVEPLEGDCSGLDSDYMEVLTGKNPSVAGTAGSIEIMSYPLRVE